jgi:hypothetical protein
MWRIALVALVVGALIAPTAAKGDLASACTPGTWERQDAPFAGEVVEMFDAFAADPTDVWAVGEYGPAGPRTTPLAIHYDGSAWTQVEVPMPDGATRAALRGVSGTSGTDVWMVGYSWDGADFAPLLEHWDGSTLSIVPAPDTGVSEVLYYGVTALSPTDAWAVGYSQTPNPNDPGRPITNAVAIHWDGAAWTQTDTPFSGGSTWESFKQVSASSPANVWALGEWDSDEPGEAGGQLVKRWDGGSWTNVPNSFEFHLGDVEAFSPTNVWFVGYEQDGSSAIRRWDGSSWEKLDAHVEDALFEVAASSPRDIWMLGGDIDDQSTSFGDHWDGERMSVFPTDQPRYTQLEGVAATSSGDVWGIGQTNTRPQEIYVQHLCPIPIVESGARLGSVAERSKRFTTTIDQGSGVAWKFGQANRRKHEVRDTSHMRLFDSGRRTRGTGYTHRFVAAGIYRWRDPVGGAHGTIRVPISVKAVSPSKALVRWSVAKPRAGYVFDVQVRAPGARRFESWLRGTRSRSARFSAQGDGCTTFGQGCAGPTEP